ncbi:hypothetical protein [Stigmatella aurantiaca]|uniref:hypothetical protein n=1 Tax=Stigmatella aurantiaca TaxID=41 RepID=UPI0002FE31A4|nr:hypothetical protein [Stigmatella aurantiaca]
MRRRILIVLLALGTAGGYASGIASLSHRSACPHRWGGAPPSPLASPSAPEGASPAPSR